MNQYFIFTDIDGTLFHHMDKKIPASTLQALNEAKKLGHKIFISSGRCYPDIDPMFKELAFDGMILGCGGQIFLGEELVACKAMPKELLHDLVDYFIKHDIGFTLEGAHKIFLYGLAYDMYRHWLSYLLEEDSSDEHLNQILLSRSTYDFSQIKEEDYEQVIKMSFFTKDKDKIDEYSKTMNPNLFVHFDNLAPDFYTGEFYMKEVNKACGMDYILEHFHHPLEYTVALGDSLNDKEMIEHAAIGIAMGNACEELKQCADYVTEHVQKDGFMLALKHFEII